LEIITKMCLVTVDFTLEEWELLDSGQKTLCREVMWEILKNMAALGKARHCSGFHLLGEGFFSGE
uniref:KRAB domain-containing protein n=1 Tax=Laticauda laticaudata TaxID=8630 RepID=A0A8C5RTZ4_LATLA